MSEQRSSVAHRALRVIAGLVVGLALAEAAFCVRDQRAFPHLNVYAPDPALGVRLRPGATQRVAFGGNPVTQVRINADGYRGADLPPPSDSEVLVVGDSQVFGLGVEEDQTFAAKLERELGGGARVVNAGVPTYGPPEFERVITEMLEKRRPKTVIYTVNFVNDPFEARRPNTERHVVWDGWAVRRETAPAKVRSFPGRELLFRDSHAFFALRQWLYFKGGGTAVTRGVPSEGNARDLFDLRAVIEREQARAETESERRGAVREAETRYATLSAINADLHVKRLTYDALKLGGEQSSVYLASNASPGDIVVPQLGEEGSPLGASVKYIREAVALRDRLEAELRRRAEASAAEPSSKEILQALEDRDALERKLRELHAAPIEIVRASLPLVDVIDKARALVESKGAKFAVLALPMDVQVSKAEWAKYGDQGVQPVEPEELRRIVEDLVEAMRERGIVAVDPTEALAAAEPGAFLAGDPHMTPKGHAAVAKALAQGLKDPPKPKHSRMLLALPEGRSRMPRPREWKLVGDLLVTGSTAAGCDTHRIREWLYVRCTAKEGKPRPTNVKVIEGGHGEALALAHGGVVTLIAPVVRGDTFVARFSWADGAKRLVIRWSKDVVEPDIGFEPDPGPPDPDPGMDVARLCACQKQVSGEATCDGLLAAPNADCLATYADSCEKLLACAGGDPIRMPTCPAGHVNAGAELWCFEPCGADGSCKAGRCVEKQGAKLCVAP